jgi:hypothetical protein
MKNKLATFSLFFYLIVFCGGFFVFPSMVRNTWYLFLIFITSIVLIVLLNRNSKKERRGI